MARTQRPVLVLPVRRPPARVPGVLHRVEVGDPRVVSGDGGRTRMNGRHVPLRIAAAVALAGVLVISPQTRLPTASALTVFSDTFASASFAAWTGTTNMTIDTGTGRAAPPSAKAQAVSGQAFAYELLPTTLDTVCMSANVNATSPGTGLPVAAPAADGRERPDRPGLPVVHGDPVGQIRRLRRPEELGCRAGDRVARHPAVRHGRGVRVVGPLPRRDQDRDRLGGQHRNHAGRPGRDR